MLYFLEKNSAFFILSIDCDLKDCIVERKSKNTFSGRNFGDNLRPASSKITVTRPDDPYLAKQPLFKHQLLP
jgi:hypothetical protein